MQSSGDAWRQTKPFGARNELADAMTLPAENEPEIAVDFRSPRLFKPGPEGGQRHLSLPAAPVEAHKLNLAIANIQPLLRNRRPIEQVQGDSECAYVEHRKDEDWPCTDRNKA
nr:hypothetical protein [Sphingobium sp. UBA5915]